MYRWLWAQLPGPIGARVVMAVLMFTLVLALLFGVVFPWLEQFLPYLDVTVG